MNEEMLFSLLETSRAGTLEAAKKVQSDYADFADTIPEGFNNNIRWNLGHVVTILDQLANYPAGEKPDLGKPFHKSFANGTSPKNWNDETPSLDEIIQALEEQPKKIKEKFAGRLADPLPQPFSLVGVEFKTVGDLIGFNLYHEGLHAGQINTMLRAAK